MNNDVSMNSLADEDMGIMEYNDPMGPRRLIFEDDTMAEVELKESKFVDGLIAADQGLFNTFPDEIAGSIMESVMELYELSARKIWNAWKEWKARAPMYKTCYDFATARRFVCRIRTEIKVLYLYIGLDGENRQPAYLTWQPSLLRIHDFGWSNDFKDHVRKLLYLVYIHNRNIKYWNKSVGRQMNGWRHFTYFNQGHGCGEALLAIKSSDNFFALADRFEVLTLQRQGVLMEDTEEIEYFVI